MGIAEAIDTCSTIIQRLPGDEDLHDTRELGIDDNGTSLLILLHIGAIKCVQGTDKVYVDQVEKPSWQERLTTLSAVLTAIEAALRQTKGDTLKKSQVLDIIEDNKGSAEDYSSITRILSKLDISTSAGKGRYGGIQLYTKEDTKKALAVVEAKMKKAAASGETDKAAAVHEEVLYKSAEKVVSDLGYTPIQLGVNRRFKGEWNTPDVIGYKVVPYKTLSGCHLDLVSIEVKWVVSKQAIAETLSHTRLSHSSYLMVHQFFEDIEHSFFHEITKNQVGLVCRDKRDPSIHSIHVPAGNNKPETVSVDMFLTQALDENQREQIKEEMGKAFFRDYVLNQLK